MANFAKRSVALCLIILCFQLSGCATVGGRDRDLTVLSPGVPRIQVIQVIGEPAWSGKKGDKDVDFFKFKQKGTDVKVEVSYDKDGKVDKIKIHKGETVIKKYTGK